MLCAVKNFSRIFHIVILLLFRWLFVFVFTLTAVELRNVYVYIIYAFTSFFFSFFIRAHILSSEGMRVFLWGTDHPSKACSLIRFVVLTVNFICSTIWPNSNTLYRRIGAADARCSPFDACVVSYYMDSDSKRGTAMTTSAEQKIKKE